MAYFNKYVTSLYGRRFGIQRLTTAIAGLSKAAEFLVGPEAVRMKFSTGESTGTNLPPYGVSNLQGTSAGSSTVFTLDPPIPGVPKFINVSDTANGPCYLKTANAETFLTTVGSTFTTIKTSAGGCFLLWGLTTGIWAALGITSGTSSNASGFVLSTTT